MFKKDWIIYKVLSGSHAYGLAREDSDYDYRGIMILDEIYYLSPFKKIKQMEDKQNDTVIYELRKYINLATQANPNVLELLFIDEKFIDVITEEGKLIRDNRNLFLSAKVKFTYSGYAFAQLKRIKNHKKWIDNPPIKPTRENLDKQHKWFNESTVVHMINEFKEFMTINLIDKLFYKLMDKNVKVDRNWLEMILRSILGDIPLYYFKDYTVRFFRSISSNFLKEEYADFLKKEFEYYLTMKEWNDYNRWKTNRNPKRAELERKYGYDIKHATQLVRLIIQGKEILTKGTLTINISNLEEIQAVKNGEWSYEYLLEWIEGKEKELDKIYKDGRWLDFIPHSPDINKIENLVLEIFNMRFKNKN